MSYSILVGAILHSVFLTYNMVLSSNELAVKRKMHQRIMVLSKITDWGFEDYFESFSIPLIQQSFSLKNTPGIDVVAAYVFPHCFVKTYYVYPHTNLQ